MSQATPSSPLPVLGTPTKWPGHRGYRPLEPSSRSDSYGDLCLWVVRGTRSPSTPVTLALCSLHPGLLLRLGALGRPVITQ